MDKSKAVVVASLLLMMILFGSCNSSKQIPAVAEPTPSIPKGMSVEEYLANQHKLKDDAIMDQNRLLADFFTNQMQGKSVDGYVCNSQSLVKLYAVRSWSIADSAPEITKGYYTIRVDSSNESGQQITALWKITVTQSKPGEFCISSIDKAQ